MASDKAFFDRYGLPFEDAKQLGISFLTPIQTKNLQPHYYEVRAMKIEYPGIKGEMRDFHRIRYMDMNDVKSVIAKKLGGFTPKSSNKSVMKYNQPSGHEPMLYFSKYMDWTEIVDDTKIPIILTEGEMKGNAACYYKIPTIPMGGVWNWASKTKESIEDFDLINWKKRKVIVLFDSDVSTKPQVKKAMFRLCDFLTTKGARIAYGGVWHEDLEVSPDLKLGIDDYLIKYGKKKFKEFLKSEHIKDYSKAAKLHMFNDMYAYVRRKKFILEYSSGDLIKPSDFTGTYAANQYIMMPKDPSDPESKMIKKKLANEWVGWESRSDLEDIVYKPGQDTILDSKYYNYWKGWWTEPKEGDTSLWDMLLDHIFGDQTIEENKQAREWFEDWCAYQFQCPGEKLYSACVFWSATQGSGKSLLGYVIGKLFGENFAVLKNRDMKSDYNGWLGHKQFALGDELKVNDNNQRTAYDFFKALITNEKSTVNEKWKPEFQVDDVTNYIFTSNHPDAFYMDIHDRRFFVWEVQSGKLDVEWATKVLDPWYRSKEGAGALFHRFLNRDTSKFNPKGHAMRTGDADRMIEGSMSKVEQWIRELGEAVRTENEAWLTARLTFQGNPVQSDFLTGNDLMVLCPPVREMQMKSQSFLGKLKIGNIPRWGDDGKGQQISLSGHGRHRFYVIRNVDKWNRATYEEVKEYLITQAEAGEILFDNNQMDF